MRQPSNADVIRKEVRRRERRRMGLTSGIFACVFAILGIFTFGFLFVPIAVLCAAISLLRSLIGGNMMGVGLSGLAWVLVIAGVATSPTLWVAFLAIVGVAAGPGAQH